MAFRWKWGLLMDGKCSMLSVKIPFSASPSRSQETLMDRTAYLQVIEQHLKSAYLLSEEKTAAMIPVFLKTLVSHVDQLAAIAASGDLEQLARSSHAIKGALLNMGLTDLAATAFTLEKESKERTGAINAQTLIAELTQTVWILADCKPPDQS